MTKPEPQLPMASRIIAFPFILTIYAFRWLIRPPIRLHTAWLVRQNIRMKAQLDALRRELEAQDPDGAKQVNREMAEVRERGQ